MFVLPAIYVQTLIYVCIAQQLFCITSHVCIDRHAGLYCNQHVCITGNVCINRHSRLYYKASCLDYWSLMYQQSFTFVAHMENRVVTVIHACAEDQPHDSPNVPPCTNPTTLFLSIRNYINNYYDFCRVTNPGFVFVIHTNKCVQPVILCNTN